MRDRQTKHCGMAITPWRGQFSVPQIEYPLGGSSKKGSQVYFLLIVAIDHYCDDRLYYCDIRTIFILDNSTI